MTHMAALSETDRIRLANIQRHTLFNELRAFASTFALPRPPPPDIVALLSKDNRKRQALLRQAYHHRGCAGERVPAPVRSMAGHGAVRRCVSAAPIPGASAEGEEHGRVKWITTELEEPTKEQFEREKEKLRRFGQALELSLRLRDVQRMPVGLGDDLERDLRSTKPRPNKLRKKCLQGGV